MEAIKYPSIGQFRNLVKDIQYEYQEMPPTLLLSGTVKVHGTNASVVIAPDGSQYPQSKNNVLTLKEDNCGFANWHKDKIDVFARFKELIVSDFGINDHESIVIYGEWAGKGVQKGVAISEVDKFFYIFGVKIVPDEADGGWISGYPSLQDGNDIIDSRGVWHKGISIDFNVPGTYQNELVEITRLVELECPIGKSMGVSGIGEGVVWEHITDDGLRFSFKVKGDKHSSSKVKKLAEVDTEKMNSIDEFIAYAVTENRLKQGFLEVCSNDADRKLLGKFIKWISTDVHKEEADTLVDSGLTMKDIGSPLSKRARNWFFAQEEL